jgi:hypothetical protein
MDRLLKLTAAFLAATMLSPVSALAYETQVTPLGLHLTVSATGLAVAIVLLLEALALRKVAFGGAIAEKIHFVILAIICLAASALAKWTSNFVTGITFEQTELISELLVLLAMGLLAGYFYSVRSAMQEFLKVMKTEQEDQGQTSGTESEGTPGA